ncbi:MAG: porin [Pseudomonadota bacterium]|nr:porin [Pseudomonadota bacterium]
MNARYIAALALVATSVTGMAQAEVEFYGHINKATMIYDDGQDTEFNIVDNNMNRTMFGIAAEKNVHCGLTASALLEMDHQTNRSSSITQNNAGGIQSTPVQNNGGVSMRTARVGLSGNWGGVFVGTQVTAIDDVFYRDLGPAGDVMGPGVSAFGGGVQFRDNTGALQTLGGTALTASNMTLGFNGDLEIADTIQYNTPVFEGFNASISAQQGGNIDTALRYEGEYEGFKVDSAIGMAFENDDATAANDILDTTLQAALSVAHESGLAGTVSYVKQSLDNKTAGVEDPTGYYVKLGYGWDNYGIAVDYSKFSDPITTSATDNELSSYGVGGQVDMGHGVSLGATYRIYEADVTGVSLDDIKVGAMTMKVKF